MLELITPAFLMPEGPALPTEYGKRWMDERMTLIERNRSVLLDVAEIAEAEEARWADIQALLEAEGVPTAISSGVSQYGMQKLVDHLNGKTSFTMPAAVALALLAGAPTSTTTGTPGNEAAYTSYARTVIAGAGFNAATPATPSVATNNGAITAPNCTGSTSTLLGFLLTDNATLATGNALWYGTLASTVISTTQTPPTIATGVLSLSMTGS